MFVKWVRAGVLKSWVDHQAVERYVIFDLDDTLVHSDAVREAFAIVGRELGVEGVRLTDTLDELPGRPAREIFEALGVIDCDAATARLLQRLDELNSELPTVADAAAEETQRALAAGGSTLMLSAGPSP